MHARLSREIRDMVYGYLWYFDPERMPHHDVGTQHLRQHHDFTCSPGTTDAIQTHVLLLDLVQNLHWGSSHDITELCDNSALPHYISPAYVGLETAQEVAMSFYCALDLAGLLQCGSKSIRSVLNRDRFDLALPTIDLIRTLTVHCQIDRYRTPPPYCTLPYCTVPPNLRRKSACQHTVSEIGHVRKAALEADFGALLDVKKKQDFKLHIILDQQHIRMEVIAEVIEALAGIVQPLQQHGACVTVSWTYRGHWGMYNGLPPRQSLVDRDVTDFFNLPRELWEYNMRKTYRAVCNFWAHATTRTSDR
ncbi:hypothetical protein ACET3X_007344 [Alternaria dauci]|uniref:Uncharacterized protein n=1 Tax=Alternaria dauci TaxID=48095 RepID=A0ABR3UBQ1_9PLEO